jgi:hypothetical protein
MIPSTLISDLLLKTVRMFYLQRCGIALQPEYAGDFAHPACHTVLSRIYGSDKKTTLRADGTTRAITGAIPYPPRKPRSICCCMPVYI